MKIEKKSFGIIPEKVTALMEAGKYEGKEIFNYHLIGDDGSSVVVTEFGACIVSINVLDKNGKIDNVSLSYDDLAGFMNNECFFGAVVGRNANRVSNAKFSINGVEYNIAKNDGVNNLHSGGVNNYAHRPYETVEYNADADKAYVKFHIYSPDGDQGYPGNMDFYVTYSYDKTGMFSITYTAKCDKDTLCNVTNHAYFNLGGHASGDAREHVVWIDSDQVTNTAEGNVPDGTLNNIAGTAFDFNTPKTIIKDFNEKHHMLPKGYDCNYVLKNNGKFEKVAYFKNTENGRVMEIYTDLPGMQMYTGNYINKLGSEGVLYKDFDGICFESQFYPDAINHPEFQSPVLKAGEVFESTTGYRFFVEK